MTQTPSENEAVRSSMRAHRSRDQGPELALRRAAFALGLRYRVATRPLADLERTAELVFTKAKVAVFVDGCFWHGCPQHGGVAKTNAQYWANKLAKNKARDEAADQLLRDAGWTVLRVWEHDDPEAAALRVRDAVVTRRNPPGS